MNTTQTQQTPARPEPKFQVGDWSYDHCAGLNKRILSVVWDDSAHGYTGAWRYHTAGLGTLHPYGEQEDAPHMEYVQTGPHSYKEAGFFYPNGDAKRADTATDIKKAAMYRVLELARSAARTCADTDALRQARIVTETLYGLEGEPIIHPMTDSMREGIARATAPKESTP